MMTRPTAMGLALCLAVFSSPRAAEDLASFVVVDAKAIPEPLVETPPDVELGQALMLGAGCAACHQKDLNGVAGRLSAGEMRLMIVAPEIRAPGTVMPAYYRVGLYGEAAEDQVGRTRLTAEEIEALVAYLQTL